MLAVHTMNFYLFFFSSRRRHTRCLSDWSSDVCSSDLERSEGADQNPDARPLPRGQEAARHGDRENLGAARPASSGAEALLRSVPAIAPVAGGGVAALDGTSAARFRSRGGACTRCSHGGL